MASAIIDHTGAVNCTSYPPNGCSIVTGPIFGLDPETGAAVGDPLEATGCGLSLALP